MNENLPKLRLLKFDSKTCAVCAAMDRRGTVDDIKREFPTLEVVTLTCANEEGEAPDGTSYDAAYNLSDDLGVQAFPTMVIQDQNGVEIDRIDGAPSLAQFRKTVQAAFDAVVESAALKLKVDAFTAKFPR